MVFLGAAVFSAVIALAWSPDALDAQLEGSTPQAAPMCEGWNLLDVRVRGSIAETLGRALGKGGDEVAAHLGRIYMWDLDLRRDVEPGDRIRLQWRRNETAEIEIRAARYESTRLGRSLRAYRFQAALDGHPSYWDETGLELPRRLKASPLMRYDQITALLKDRPTHKGMDFKTAVGTEITSPRAGVATRVNWKIRGNGNCVEIRYNDGTLAKFLHLSEIKVKRGASVRPGQVIALTGNTGRSTAPHLHYQLNRGPRTVDPVDYHGVLRRRLEGKEREVFLRQIAAFNTTCGATAP
jgi:murein DD-endopeptidase